MYKVPGPTSHPPTTNLNHTGQGLRCHSQLRPRGMKREREKKIERERYLYIYCCIQSVMFLLFCVFLFFSKGQTRDSGGMIIWTKSELSIELVKREQYHLWLKIKKGIISTSQPVFLCAIYVHTSPGVSLFPRRNFSKHRARNQPFPGPGKCATCG